MSPAYWSSYTSHHLITDYGKGPIGWNATGLLERSNTTHSWVKEVRGGTKLLVIRNVRRKGGPEGQNSCPLDLALMSYVTVRCSDVFKCAQDFDIHEGIQCQEKEPVRLPVFGITPTDTQDDWIHVSPP
jgi:hypothetical protein